MPQYLGAVISCFIGGIGSISTFVHHDFDPTPSGWVLIAAFVLLGVFAGIYFDFKLRNEKEIIHEQN